MKKIILLFIVIFHCNICFALTLPLPKKGHDIAGHVKSAMVRSGDNFEKIARKYDVGYFELIEANPNIDPEKPQPGTVLIIPTEYVLPQLVRKGIIINLAEMRLYYFPKGKKVVMTYPLGIGREGWNTPLGLMKIMQKQKNPTWYVPDSIREARKEQGVELPKTVAPGPDNPLGKYSLRLSAWTYLIHGTNEPKGVGKRTSSGCLRMFPEDIEQLYENVKVGTRVYIIDSPFKAGWENGKLYLESHLPLQEMQKQAKGNFKPLITAAVKKAIKKVNQKNVSVYWKKAYNIAHELQGLPQVIGNMS